jgi:beta-carotene 15,15'-dioxygenase
VNMLETPRQAWFSRVRATHGWLWMVVAFTVSVLSVAGVFNGLTQQDEILVLLVAALIGTPHGALDHWLGREVFAAPGGTRHGWAAKFFVVYLGLAALVALFWWWQPVWVWIAFLLVSAVHFGAGDVADGGDARGSGWLDIAVMGASTILVPYLMYPDEVAKLFGWITMTSPARWAAFAVHPVLRWVLLLVALGWIAHRLFLGRAKSADSWRQPPLLVEFVVVAALFAMVRPLLAFSIYFALLHAPRHTLVLASRLRTRDRWRDVAWVLAQSIPLTLVTVIAGGWLYWWITASPVAGTSHGETGIADVVRTVFWVLAALTFPHMWITSRWDRQYRHD